MIGHKSQEFLVMPEEAVRLSRKYDTGGLDLLEYCREFFRVYSLTINRKKFGEDYFFYACLATVFDAGVIQGQRQERKRKGGG